MTRRCGLISHVSESGLLHVFVPGFALHRFLNVYSAESASMFGIH